MASQLTGQVADNSSIVHKLEARAFLPSEAFLFPVAEPVGVQDLAELAGGPQRSYAVRHRLGELGRLGDGRGEGDVQIG